MISEYTSTLNGEFSTLNDNARLWIFQSERALSEDEQSHILKHLHPFLGQWTSHTKSLLAKGAVLFDHFIVIALDESQSSQASGCSIDSMTHHIQGIARSLNVDLLNRSIFYFLMDDVIRGFPMTGVAEAYREGVISDDTPVFNNLIKTKKELDESWIIPLKDSWHKRFL